jgi:hypothetical protein
MRAWTSGVALILTCGILPVSVLAQAGVDPEGRQQVGCFRGRPPPACKSFWIVEMQGVSPVAQTSRIVENRGGPTYRQEAFSSQLEWNLGHMVNMGPRYAIGGVVTAGTGNGDALTALKLRVRRWLGSDLSLEAEGGLLWNDANGGSTSGAIGGTAALRLNIRDQGSFFLRWDMLPLASQSYSFYDPGDPFIGGYHDPGGTQHALSIGVGTGSVPALITTAATGLTLAVLLALFPYD